MISHFYKTAIIIFKQWSIFRNVQTRDEVFIKKDC